MARVIVAREVRVVLLDPRVFWGAVSGLRFKVF